MPDNSEFVRSARETLLEVASEPLCVVDTERELVTVNRPFTDLSGYTESELLEADPATLLAADEQAWNHRFQLLLRDEAGTTEEWSGYLCSKNGTEVPVEWHCRVVDVAGRTTLAARVEDLREKRQQEQKLEVLNRVLRHNIRNQINVVIGKASLLQGIDDEGYRTAAEKIEEMCQRVINSSNKARRAQEHIDVPPDPDCRIDLVEPVEQAVRSFRIGGPLATVRSELPPSAPARAPPSVDIAVQELLENAAVHSPEEEPEITVGIESGDDRTHIHVADRCDPIPAEVQETIGQGTEGPLHHNDGLGLWIVAWITDAVDGELSFDRRPDDSGNVVTLSFESLEGSDIADTSDTPAGPG